MVQVHEFKVAMTCEGCSGAVERVLGKHKDKIENVDISLADQKVKVKTNLPATEVLELIKKTGKDVQYVAST
ncbi:antioxidant 1 copper chaperone [Rhynchophorus ferrugineus]|uniref:antioxidant 1 copper chaperone n=1 Tax=Rhynchophorus ferrugineus TaxID=354439 RepID=UPI003FCD5FC5